jgi:hypothetical protein
MQRGTSRTIMRVLMNICGPESSLSHHLGVQSLKQKRKCLSECDVVTGQAKDRHTQEWEGFRHEYHKTVDTNVLRTVNSYLLQESWEGVTCEFLCHSRPARQYLNVGE